MVKELRTIERELLADRQKAELAAAAPPDGRRGGRQRSAGREHGGNEPGTTGVDASKLAGVSS